MNNEMLPLVVFVLGPSGSGKSTLGRFMADSSNWQHLEIDQFPNGDGIEWHGLREEWDAYFTNENTEPLIERLHALRAEAGRQNIVLTFPGNLVACLRPNHIRRLRGMAVAIVLSGEPEHCMAAFIRSERGRNLGEVHWHKNNDHLFSCLRADHLAPHVVDAFEDNGDFRAINDVYDEVISRAQNQFGV